MLRMQLGAIVSPFGKQGDPWWRGGFDHAKMPTLGTAIRVLVFPGYRAFDFNPKHAAAKSAGLFEYAGRGKSDTVGSVHDALPPSAS